MLAIIIHSGIFQLKTDTEMDMETETDMERKRKRTWKRKRKLTIHRHGNGHGHGHEHRHGTEELSLCSSYGTIVPVAPYGLPLKYHGTIFNGAIYVLVVPLHYENSDMRTLKNLYCCWNSSPNGVLAELAISV
jgi:hypothetical protein